tara:strand:- start:35 stop:280 length:246 start_codon:yes stop_codon:yes gene_type:complete
LLIDRERKIISNADPNLELLMVIILLGTRLKLFRINTVNPRVKNNIPKIKKLSIFTFLMERMIIEIMIIKMVSKPKPLNKG